MSIKNQPIEDRLSQLWQEGAKEIAISFLKRAVHPDLTLAELESILRFDAVSGELNTIHLRDILSAPAPKPQKASDAASPKKSAARTGTTGKRRNAQRRSPKVTEAMREVLLRSLQESPRGLSTPQLCDCLKRAGYKCDAPTATLLLRNIEIEGLASSDNSRPKTWQAKNAGRRVPAPVIIRKANFSGAEE